MQFKVKRFGELTTAELYEILKSRSEIFLLEQNIVCQDMDDVDYDSLHCFLQENGRITAYLRAYYKEDDASVIKLGRVLSLEHGVGLGTRLMQESIDYIRVNLPCEKLSINAQCHAVGFYERFGFRVVSDEFLEEGVPHVAMDLEI